MEKKAIVEWCDHRIISRIESILVLVLTSRIDEYAKFNDNMGNDIYGLIQE